MESVNKSLNTGLQEQIEATENFNTYVENWNIAYKKEDFNQMEHEYEKIQNEMQSIMPGEAALNGVRKN